MKFFSPFVACCVIVRLACLFTQVKLGKLYANNKPNENTDVNRD